jgi:hypothetical protein
MASRSIQSLHAQALGGEGSLATYAVIGDSDNDPRTRLDEIHFALRANGQPQPPHATFLPNTDGIRVGTFLIPSDVGPGDLEKLCLETLEDDGLLNDCRAFVTEIENKHGAFRAPYKSLAQIYFACRPEDTRGVGKAFRDDLFDANHSSLDPIKAFLADLIK